MKNVFFSDDQLIPNSSLPVIVYTGVFSGEQADDPASYEKLFRGNSWAGSWRNGVFPFHHYHSTAHEVLGVYSGKTDILLGGESGTVFTVQAGDVLILPAGTGHKNLGQSTDFAVVGAYPLGQRPDMNYGREGERPAALEQIGEVPLPGADPVQGSSGPLTELWKQ